MREKTGKPSVLRSRSPTVPKCCDLNEHFLTQQASPLLCGSTSPVQTTGSNVWAIGPAFGTISFTWLGVLVRTAGHRGHRFASWTYLSKEQCQDTSLCFVANS